jgi:hypothetical protein
MSEFQSRVNEKKNREDSPGKRIEQNDVVKVASREIGGACEAATRMPEPRARRVIEGSVCSFDHHGSDCGIPSTKTIKSGFE